jgi:hypothetical protein
MRRQSPQSLDQSPLGAIDELPQGPEIVPCQSSQTWPALVMRLIAWTKLFLGMALTCGDALALRG